MAGNTSKTERITPRTLADRPGSVNGVSLLVYHHDGAHIINLVNSAPFVLGRSAPANLVVPDTALSRQHARFSLVEGKVLVEDLGSTNGTLLDGQPITTATLGPGQELRIGGVVVTLAQLAPGRVGSGRDLAGHDRFRARVDAEVVRARFYERRVSVILVRARGEKGNHVRFWLPRIEPLLRPVDQMGLYSEDALQILMPETSSADAARVAKAILAGLGNEPPAVCGIACFPDSASHTEELLGETHGACQRATLADPIRVAPEEERRMWSRPNDPVGNAPIGESPAMKKLLTTAARVAKGHIPVLLLGETGSGKEVVARFIHDWGPRRQKPLICVNCAAIPPSLLESTLFGHEKGAFTGASAQQKGVFEAADGGTVFLDEIGELTPPAQAALLRVLETKGFNRVGSTKETTVDVRMIAATHRDLEGMVEDGQFRQDLMFRLNTLTLTLPPLRERREDVPALARRFLEQANRDNKSELRAIDPTALDMLRAYAWPGNVRELKNAMERAVVIAQGDTVTCDDLPERVRMVSLLPGPPDDPAGTLDEVSASPAAGRPSSVRPQVSPRVDALDGDFRSRMERLEEEVLVHALERAGWNQSLAARQLEMPLRTLTHKIRQHGIRRPPREA